MPPRRRSPRIARQASEEDGGGGGSEAAGEDEGWLQGLDDGDWECVWKASRLAEENPITRSPLDYLQPASGKRRKKRPTVEAALELLDTLTTGEDFDNMVECFRATGQARPPTGEEEEEPSADGGGHRRAGGSRGIKGAYKGESKASYSSGNSTATTIIGTFA
ncbi:hypothetical protein FOL47_009952 [Perkinsus chesapeaki]|uniref:Uncharacterized protein n=1 Tax=Perkinsus chesapeaki TaxID=330153 RepID=A0A7J6MSJ2_PERCH|nr:hypothetical protein FOL47_009952 [Perkinsus chesapeaki]